MTDLKLPYIFLDLCLHLFLQGALGMARTEDDVDSGDSQFFFLLFDSDLTPAGKNLLDGSYACFGYTVEGASFLKDVKEGDIIVKASVLDGMENLHRA